MLITFTKSDGTYEKALSDYLSVFVVSYDLFLSKMHSNSAAVREMCCKTLDSEFELDSYLYLWDVRVGAVTPLPYVADVTCAEVQQLFLSVSYYRTV